MRVEQYIASSPIKGFENSPPLLMVVIDTEEEFDWTRPHDRNSVSISAIREIYRVQDIFDKWGIRPTYVVDYAIAAQAISVSTLNPIISSGRAEIGAHLHPWLSPPFEEAVTAFNSYPGNLPPGLEAKKIETLKETISRAFGVCPKIYKAGRYGIGPNTVEILSRHGFEIDLSFAPPFNYELDGGPDFTSTYTGMAWLGADKRILELPATGGYTGILGRYGGWLQSIGQRPQVAKFRLLGALSRLGLLNHSRLSPEQYRLAQMVQLTRALIDRGIRVLSFTFHSPTIKPGCTPYVSDAADLRRFIADCIGYFEFFFDQLGGESVTPLELKQMLIDNC